MSQFDNPSAVAPFRGGYLMLMGMGNGKDGRHGLQLRYGPIIDPDKLPDFQPIAFQDVDSSKPDSTSTVTQNGVNGGAVPFLFALDDTTMVAVYSGQEEGVDGVFAHVFSDTGASLIRVGAYQVLAKFSDPTAWQIAASMVPGKAGFLLSVLGDPPLWCTVPSFTPGTSASVVVATTLSSPSDAAAATAMATADSAHGADGYISMVIVPNNTGLGDPPAFAIGYYAFWSPVVKMGGAMPFQISFTDPSGPPSIAWQQQVSFPPSEPFFLFSGPDGLPWYQLVGSTMSVGQVNADGSLASPTVIGKGASSPAAILFTFGPFDANPEPGSDPEIVPVYRSLLTGLNSAVTTQIGNARRTIFLQEPATNQQGTLIGIFESGPPVPNANAAALSAGPSVGSTTFGEQSSQTSGWSIAASVGGFIQYSASNGIPDVATMDTSFNIAFGVNTSFSQSTTLTKLDTHIATTAIIGTPPSVSPQGLALVAIFDYIGSKYEFLDSGLNPVPGAAVYYEMTVSSTTFSVMPFDYPAGNAPYPGDLLSYPTVEDVRESYAVETLSDTDPAAFSWSTAGSDQVSGTIINSGSKSVGAYLNFNASIGAKVGPPGESVTVSAGVTASFTFNYQWTAVSQDQFSTMVTLPALNNPPPPGAYAAYTYCAYLLDHDNTHAADLIALLQANPTSHNTALFNAISPQSTPWKVAYAIANSESADVRVALG